MPHEIIGSSRPYWLRLVKEHRERTVIDLIARLEDQYPEHRTRIASKRQLVGDTDTVYIWRALYHLVGSPPDYRYVELVRYLLLKGHISDLVLHWGLRLAKRRTRQFANESSLNRQYVEKTAWGWFTQKELNDLPPTLFAVVAFGTAHTVEGIAGEDLQVGQPVGFGRDGQLYRTQVIRHPDGSCEYGPVERVSNAEE